MDDNLRLIVFALMLLSGLILQQIDFSTMLGLFMGLAFPLTATAQAIGEKLGKD